MVSKFNNFRPQLVFAEQSAGSAVVLTTEQKLSLYKKSQKSGISTDVLEEVYRRGYIIWNESFGQTAEQFAFDRVNSFIAGGFAAELDEDLRQWFDKDHPKGGWKRYNSKGEAIGPCARENPGEAKPKCMSNEKAASLSKKERAAAVAAKRRHDPNPERKGKPINVSNFGKGKISEMTDITEENKPTNPALWSKAKSLARQKFDVYPSAYANGWAAKWYKSKGGGWKSVSEETVDEDCWKGYKRVGMKKKGERMVPNCVPEETSEAQTSNPNDPSSRFDGTDSLVNIYKRSTPGQMKESTLSVIKRVISEAEYKTKKGDTLSSIAKKHGTTVKDLAAINNITNVNRIGVGQNIRLRSAETPKAAEVPKPETPKSKEPENVKPLDKFDQAKRDSEEKSNAQSAVTDQGIYRISGDSTRGIPLPKSVSDFINVIRGNPRPPRSQQDIDVEIVRAAQQRGSTIGSRHGAEGPYDPYGDLESAKKTLKTIKEATHQGRKVTLNKPFRTPGGPKKSAVYVDPDGDGKAKIVRFGDPKLSIKKDQPARKRSYCARSSGQGNLTKKDSANYWSRKAWDC